MDDLEPIAGYVNKRTMLEALYVQEGLSVKAISSRIGTGSATVIRWMRELGVPRRSRGGDNNPARLGWRLHRIDPRLLHTLPIRTITRMVQVSESYTFKFKKGEQIVWILQLLPQSRDSSDTLP